MTIDRAFYRGTAGLIHYRMAGSQRDAPPLVMIHGGPGSSAGLAPMIAALAGSRRVIAPDLMGNGASDPPPHGPVTISFHADRIAELLDALGLDRVNVYGHHSGAQVACELAIAQPGRVARLILNGLGLFTAEQRSEFALRYAPPVEPKADGSHLSALWDFAGYLTQFFPHYRHDDEHRIEPGMVLPPEVVTRIVADIVQVWPTYHRLYEAAFAHDLVARLPLVAASTLVLRVEGDPLAVYADEAAKLLTASRIVTTIREGVASATAAFLGDQQHA